MMRCFAVNSQVVRLFHGNYDKRKYPDSQA